jgi:K+-sensing histidine kinase KdpD
MTTLIDSIDLMKQESGDEYKIHKEFWDLLSENNQHTLSMLKGLDSSVNILQGTINLKPISSDELIRLLPILSSEFSEELEKKKVKVNLPIVKTKTSLSCDLDLLKIALRELFVNGIKYSETNSNFDIFMTFVDGYFCLSLKNNVMDDEYNKLIPSHEKQLVLPFFRIHPPVESFYKKEPFSLGLGLTMVDFILQKHHGMFFIRKAIDHTCEKSHCVISEIFLPIQTTKDKTT